MKFYRTVAITLCLFAMFLVSVTPIAAQDKLCTTASDVDTFAIITNSTNHPLQLYWIDYDCVEQDYGIIEAGQTVIQPTFVTHPWILRAVETGEQVGEIFVADSANPFVHEAVCSLVGEVATPFTIVNTGDVSVQYNWVDYDCKEVEYGVLAPGESVIVETFETHPWVLRDADTGAFISSAVAEILYGPPTP